jgi:hypothetical protein
MILALQIWLAPQLSVGIVLLVMVLVDNYRGGRAR